jgi:CspA family cold shock protein
VLSEQPTIRFDRLTPDIVNVATIVPLGAARRPTRVKGKDDMATGTVKWFNPAKGYGFIEPSDGGKDAFVHISAVERAGLSSLTEGQKVSYELQQGQNGKTSAENLSVLD